MKEKIGIIGGGNMGAAIINGIYQDYSVKVCEKDSTRRRYLKRRFSLDIDTIEGIIQDSSIVILAIKPQDFDSVLKELSIAISGVSGRNRRRIRIISIAAGITTAYIEKRLGAEIRVIRAMPNLPAQVGMGITAICAGQFSKRKDLRDACSIFNKVGSTVIVEERLMDAVTAVSGSGPAYVFLFVECLNKAANALGLKGLGNKLVIETLKGSLRLLETQKEDAATLRARVTSKGGTTQAAIDVFSASNIENIFKMAIIAAKKRAKELSR